MKRNEKYRQRKKSRRNNKEVDKLKNKQCK